jgi:putative component of membrane protein insertase Oxa1/YidC/SpoIIIJ protein YidD
MSSLKFFIILPLLFFSFQKISAQNLSADLVLLRQSQKQKDSLANVPEKSKALKPGRSINYANPFYWLLRGAMFSYQNAISPQISANCTFSLTCSNYSKQAFKEAGIFLGVLMSADRLTRCSHSTREETPAFYLDDNGKLSDEPWFYLKKY